MLKKIPRISILCFIFIMCFYNTVYADPIVPQPGYKSFLFDLIFDIVVIILSFLLLKIFKGISIQKIIFYIAVVYINGLICDLISSGLISYLSNLDELMTFFRRTEILKIFAVVGFIIFSGFILFISNYLYARFILKLGRKKSIIIGIIIAVFTHPIIGAMINFNDSFLFYESLFS